MRISYNWLKELIDSGLSVTALERELTMAGLEIEGIEPIGDDYAMEVNVTPNRPDCLSILGIAREVHALTGATLHIPQHAIASETDEGFTVEIADEDLCGRYAGRVVRGVKIGPSPKWMAQRLELCGIRPINNVVDCTNYVLLEFGHPLHAFDLAYLKGNKIRIGRAGTGLKMATLDSVQRAMPADALMIWDAERPVAVAGVMGGANSEVRSETRDLFIESAWFLPESVRKTSKALGLKTEASYRFERGTDIVMLGAALDRVTKLILQTSGGTTGKVIDVYPRPYQPVTITVKFQKVNRMLGTSLSNNEIMDIISKVTVSAKAHGETFEVVPPSCRPDLTMDADIIEEVARLFGYDNIPSVMPATSIAAEPDHTGRAFLALTKTLLRKEGFSEQITLSFLNEAHLDALRIAADDRRRVCVAIQNPLRQEDGLLRTTLIPALIVTFGHNLYRGQREVKLFEVAKAFYKNAGVQADEHPIIGGIFYREKTPTLYKETAEDFFITKGAIEGMLAGLGIEGVKFAPSAEPFLQPGKAADVIIAGKCAGFLGALRPDVIEAFDIKTRAEAYVFELQLEAIKAALPGIRKYAPIPRYPAIERDIALLIDDSARASDIEAMIRAYPSELIEGVRVFDSYKGKNIPQGKKSLAFNVRYRSLTRTLTDEDIETVHAGLIADLAAKTGAEVRKA